VALLVQGVMTSLFLAMSFVGSSVEQAYKVLLSLAVVLQLIPFLYMYGALIRIAAGKAATNGPYGRKTLWAAGISGFVTTAVGMGVAFVPPADEVVWIFELKMALGCMFIIGLGAFFFFVYSRRVSARRVLAQPAISTRGEGS
jgi:amino acid transporter